MHYDQKDDKTKEFFYNKIKEKNLEGIALDNCVAIEYVDGISKIIKSNPNKKAYKFTYKNDKIIKEEIIE